MVGRLGTKLTVALGLAFVAGGLWQISGATVTTTYSGVVVGAIMIGVGAGLVMPASTGSLMGTLPLEHTGVGSATNGTFLNIGGALGVAILGSIMATRYQHKLGAAPPCTFSLPRSIRPPWGRSERPSKSQHTPAGCSAPHSQRPPAQRS